VDTVRLVAPAVMVHQVVTVTVPQVAAADMVRAVHQAPAVRLPAAAHRLAVHRAAHPVVGRPASVVHRARLPVAEAAGHRAVRRLAARLVVGRLALAEHLAAAADMVRPAVMAHLAAAADLADQRVAEPMFLRRQWFCSSAQQQQACLPVAALPSRRSRQKQPDFSQAVELNLKRAARNGRPFSFSR
jgi:hypothetical protein